MEAALADRRSAPRSRHVVDHGIVHVRVRPGHEACVVDVSAGGLLVESRHRLLPGARVELQFETLDGRAHACGRVIRCIVSRLEPGVIWYCGAVGFDLALPWLNRMAVE